MKSHMKILDLEDDGQDMIEDILQNINQDQIKDNKSGMEENVNPMLKSQEKENEHLNQRNAKGGTYYTDIWPPETFVSKPDEEEQKEAANKENKENSEVNRKNKLQRFRNDTSAVY